MPRAWLRGLTVLLVLATGGTWPGVALAVEGAVQVDADGHAYRVKRLAKQGLRYRRLEGGWVRVAPYFQYRLEREDEQYLYVREYVAPPSPTAPAVASGTAKQSAVPNADANAAAAGLDPVDRVDLAPFSDGLPTAGQWRNGFALADMNGDRQLDLVHGPPRKGGGGPRIYLGDGAGRWRPWSDATYPPGSYDYGAVAVADFDGDGHLDIALGAHLTGISVLLGDGKGHFRAGNVPRDFPGETSAPFTTRALLARDWNRDGTPDLLAMGEGPSRGGGRSLGWSAFLNQGGGRWQKQAQTRQSSRTFGDALAAGDFDADGHDDLLTASLSLGNRDIVHYGGPHGRTLTLEAIHPQALVYSVASADFDADGRSDLAIGSLSNEAGRWRSQLELLLARPDGSWRQVVLSSRAGRSAFYAIAAGDVDGDGRRDLAATDDTGTLRLFLGDGRGTFAAEDSPELKPLGAGCRGYDVQLADLNGDRRAEVVAAFASEVSPASGKAGCPGEGRLQVWTPQPKSR
jgi:hypothetical protein